MARSGNPWLRMLMASMIAAIGLTGPSWIIPAARADAAPTTLAMTAPSAPAEAMPVGLLPRRLESIRGASISGIVKIKGPTKRRRKIKMDADPKCAAMYAETPLAEDIVVDAEGNVQWAFVYVKKGADGLKPSDPLPTALINQTGCHYVPHVLGVVVGQDLIIRNSDDLLHNIHALPFANREFNFGQPTRGLEETKQFTTQEIMVKVKCDVHPWMSAWIGVVNHGFFAVTGADGRYAIPRGLPDGKYTVEVWHEGYQSVSAEVEVKGGTGVADFELTTRRE